MIPTYDGWCRSLGIKNNINPVLLSHYRQCVNIQRGLGR